MKKILFTISLLICAFSSFAQNAQNQLTHLLINTNEKNVIAYALNETPVVSFEDDFLIIKSGDSEFSYPLESIEKISYGIEVSAGLVNILTDEPSFKLNGDAIIFSNIKPNSHITVHSMAGLMILDKKVLEEGEFCLPISDLISGIYIISVNKIAHKFIKR